MTRPWLKFYPSDWRGDPRLRMCSLAARGLWIDLISYMHEGEPYGHLTINGIQPDIGDIAALVARPLAEVRKALAELEAKQVFSRAESGAVYSRRMARDKAKEDRDRENGKGGGNPNLLPPVNQGVNPPDKAHIPDTRIQRLETHLEQKQVSSFSGVGKKKANGWSPPRHGATGKGRVYIQQGSVEWSQYAEDYRSVHSKDPMPNEYGGKWFKTLGEAS